MVSSARTNDSRPRLRMQVARGNDGVAEKTMQRQPAGRSVTAQCSTATLLQMQQRALDGIVDLAGLPIRPPPKVHVRPQPLEPVVQHAWTIGMLRTKRTCSPLLSRSWALGDPT